MKISQRANDCIKAVQTNDPSVVDHLRGLDLNKETTPLYILINFKNWGGLKYAIENTQRLDVLLQAAATAEWLEAVDLILPHATSKDVLNAAVLCANTNKLEGLKRLAQHCTSLHQCVIPACFSRHAVPVLDFLLERGEAQSVRDQFKNICRENDPHMMSLVHGEKFWGALDFLREHTTRWELEQATKSQGCSIKNKKI